MNNKLNNDIFNINIEKSCSFIYLIMIFYMVNILYDVKLRFSRKLCWVVYIFFEVKLRTLLVKSTWVVDIFFIINYEWYLFSMKVKREVNIVFEV